MASDDARPSGPNSKVKHHVKRLDAHAWPGNVRELENALMQAAILARERSSAPTA